MASRKRGHEPDLSYSARCDFVVSYHIVSYRIVSFAVAATWPDVTRFCAACSDGDENQEAVRWRPLGVDHHRGRPLLLRTVRQGACAPPLFAYLTRNLGNAQRDGRPAEHRWRPLFNAGKFGWRSLLDCRAVTLPRRESHWILQGCPKLVNRSQPLVGRSSPYCEDMWMTYCCLTFFSDCRYVP